MSVQLSLGHTVTMSIDFLDQHGNPMIDPVKFDSPPVWTNTTPATETVVAALDGKSAIGTPVANGSDTVTVTALVGTVKYTAQLDVNVIIEAQVLTSIAINPVVDAH